MRIGGNGQIPQSRRPVEDVVPRTPGLVLGPFYPVHLAQCAGEPARRPASAPAATGRRLELAGQVLDTSGQALAGAWIELWHADPLGRYRHPAQPDVERVDPHFRGYESMASQADGGWQVSTLVPGPYGHDGVERAPHLHFQVTHGHTRLVTQMFFPGHALNQADPWYAAVVRPAALVATTRADEPGRLSLAWNIVLAPSR